VGKFPAYAIQATVVPTSLKIIGISVNMLDVGKKKPDALASGF